MERHSLQSALTLQKINSPLLVRFSRPAGESYYERILLFSCFDENIVADGTVK